MGPLKMKTETNQPSFFQDPYFKVMMISGLIKSTTGTFLMTMGGSILVYSQVQPGNYIWHAPITGCLLILAGVIVYFIGDLYKVMQKRREDQQRMKEQQEKFLTTMAIISELEEQLCRDIINLRGGCEKGACDGDYCHPEVVDLYEDITSQTPPGVIVKKAILVIEGRGESATDSRILLELIRMNREGRITPEQLQRASEI